MWPPGYSSVRFAMPYRVPQHAAKHAVPPSTSSRQLPGGHESILPLPLLCALQNCTTVATAARTGWTSNLTDATAELAGHICKGQLHATVGPRQLQPSCLGSNPPLMVAKLDCTQPQLKLAQLHTLYSFFALKHKLRPCSCCPRTREQTEDRYQPRSNVQPDAPTACAATTAAGHSNKHCNHTALLLQPPLTSQNTGRGHPHSCTPKPPLLGWTLGTPTAAHMKLSLLLLLHPLPGCDCHCRTA
jgi:hypothetical protein